MEWSVGETRKSGRLSTVPLPESDVSTLRITHNASGGYIANLFATYGLDTKLAMNFGLDPIQQWWARIDNRLYSRQHRDVK